MSMPTGDEGWKTLSELVAIADLPPLDPELEAKFDRYLDLILRWNTKMNLTAIRDREGILKRHFLESIACAFFLPEKLGTLLDFGSGAGFPGLPIALCRPEIAVTLAESQAKKAAFLREAVRSLDLKARVFAGRAEDLREQFDCVTLRAVDHIERAVSAASELVNQAGLIALLSTEGEVESLRRAAGPGFIWTQPRPMPGTLHQVLDIGVRT